MLTGKKRLAPSGKCPILPLSALVVPVSGIMCSGYKDASRGGTTLWIVTYRRPALSVLFSVGTDGFYGAVCCYFKTIIWSWRHVKTFREE